MQLLQPKFVSGDPPELLDEGGADASPAPVGVGLEVVDGAPVPDQPVGVAVEDDPPGQDVTDRGHQEPAPLRVQAAERLVRDRPDVVIANRGKGESGRAARVGDRNPAIDQISPQLR